jgi:hypothetical protein
MQLNLNGDEVATLKGILSDHLPDLQREAAATDLSARELKHELDKRVALVKQILVRLGEGNQ